MERFAKLLQLRSAENRIVRYLYIGGQSRRHQLKYKYRDTRGWSYQDWNAWYISIIHSTAPYIEVLTVPTLVPRFPVGLRLPRLRDLSISKFGYTGDFDHSGYEHPPDTPSLLRLHLWGSISSLHVPLLIRFAPQLGCLRLSGVLREASLPTTLGRLLGLSLEDFGHEQSTAGHPTLRRILIEPLPYMDLVDQRNDIGPDRHREMMDGLGRLDEATRGRSPRVVLLPTRNKKHMYDNRQAYLDWIEVVRGGKSKDSIHAPDPGKLPEGPWIGCHPK
jgi:hypothetical protein